MNIMRSLFIVLIMMCTTLAHARPPEAVVNIENINIQTNNPLTQEQAGALIVEAAKSQGWSATPNNGTGTLILSKSWNTHTIVSQIKYTANVYSVFYKDSINMDYAVREGVPTIHPYYNKYVKLLTEAIRVQAYKY